MRYPVAPFSAVAALLCLGSAALADISLCNDFGQARIYVALAFQDQGKFTAAGWWGVDPNQCVPADFSFAGATLYYTADSDDYKDGRSTMRDHWGNKTQLYVGSKDFKFDNAAQSRRGAKGEMFSQLDLTDQQQGKPVTITFHFTKGSTTINVRIK